MTRRGADTHHRYPPPRGDRGRGAWWRGYCFCFISR